jgi:hypothetical protein
VVAALTLICVDQSKRDQQLVERIALLKAASLLRARRSRNEEWLGGHARNL